MPMQRCTRSLFVQKKPQKHSACISSLSCKQRNVLFFLAFPGCAHELPAHICPFYYVQNTKGANFTTEGLTRRQASYAADALKYRADKGIMPYSDSTSSSESPPLNLAKGAIVNFSLGFIVFDLRSRQRA